MRTRLAFALLISLIALAGLSVLIFGWFGFRVFTELSPGSWKTPTQIIDRNGDTLLKVYGAEWRVTDPIEIEDLPDHVQNAFIAAEDVRFRGHFGIDPVGIGRAALRNVKAGGIAEGGSTITQQLAKTRFFTQERTFTRKALELVAALLIELRLSKDEILEAYLNDVYLGHREGRSIAGVDEAARAYFRKSPNELSLAESALLAGMIRAPNRDNPDERAKVARERRDAVLGVMLDRKWITKDEHDSALRQRVRFRPGTLPSAPHPYLLAALRSELVEREGARVLRSGGLKIYTAVDATMQKEAESAVRRGVQRLRGRHSWLRRKAPLQAAILSIDPGTGGIRALVGGSDFRKSQFDRTRRMKRQPGSAFKPFTYAAAIAEKTITPATVVEDKPVEIQLARNDIWKPQNYDERYRGRVTVREAFEKSLNTPAVQIADEVGVRNVRNVLEEAGVEGDLSDTPAVALGVNDVSMRELVGAYTVFPNLGHRTDPHLIEKIESPRGRTIYKYRQGWRKKQVLDPAVAYVVHSLMRGVVQRGTASDLSHLGLGHIAGKTGTTNDYRDAWFVGYAPDLLTAVWVGFDDGKPLRISSAEAALPIWAAYMVRAPHQRADLKAPDGVEIVPIEPASGLRWRPECGARLDEVFLDGTAPDGECRGRVERPPIFIQFEEPPIITIEESTERTNEIPSFDDVQIVIDPAAGLPPEDDDDPDVLNEEERDAIDRQIDAAREQLERMRRGETPPIAPPADREESKEDRKEERKIEKEIRKQQKELEKLLRKNN